MEANQQIFQGILSALIHILSTLLKDSSPSEVDQVPQIKMILNIVKKTVHSAPYPPPSALAPQAKTPTQLSSAYPDEFLCSLPSALSLFKDLPKTLTHHLLLCFPVSRLST